MEKAIETEVLLGIVIWILYNCNIMLFIHLSLLSVFLLTHNSIKDIYIADQTLKFWINIFLIKICIHFDMTQNNIIFHSFLSLL